MRWIVNLQQPWELGHPGQQTVTAIALDPVNPQLLLDSLEEARSKLNTVSGLCEPHSEFQRISPQKRANG